MLKFQAVAEKMTKNFRGLLFCRTLYIVIFMLYCYSSRTPGPVVEAIELHLLSSSVLWVELLVALSIRVNFFGNWACIQSVSTFSSHLWL